MNGRDDHHRNRLHEAFARDTPQLLGPPTSVSDTILHRACLEDVSINIYMAQVVADLYGVEVVIFMQLWEESEFNHEEVTNGRRSSTDSSRSSSSTTSEGTLQGDSKLVRYHQILVRGEASGRQVLLHFDDEGA